MDKITERVKNFIDENDMFGANTPTTLVIGVSGGADSVCLLKIMRDLAPIYGYNIEVSHINHLIREDAIRDQNYVRELCEKWGLSFHSHSEDVRDLAGREGLSEEEAGRKVRYGEFHRIAVRSGGRNACIATAHHRGDAAETVLFNLFRGSGLKGLEGIAPVSLSRDPGKVGEEGDPIILIRPLLCLDRAEIEEYLAENGIGWCTDITNESDDYTRNRIRNKIISYVEGNICSNAVGHICETANRMREAGSFIQKEVTKAYGRCVLTADGPGAERAAEPQAAGGFKPDVPYDDRIRIDCLKLGREDPFIVGELLLRALGKAAGRRKDLERIHVDILRDLCLRGGNRKVSLPGGLTAVREYGTVYLGKEAAEAYGESSFTGPKELAYTVRTFETKDLPEDFLEKEIPKKGYTKWFDYDKILKCAEEAGLPVFRKRAPGDYIVINDRGDRKSIKRYMIDEKIPPSQRDEIPLLAQGSHILWVLGRRTSSFYNIESKTKTVWEVRTCQRQSR